MKVIASGSRDQIRLYAQEMAGEDAAALSSLAAADGAQALPSEFSYIIPTAKANLDLSGRDVPRNWTVADALSAFRSQNELARAMEAHHRDEILDLKAQKDKIIQLGLDLSGGLRVILEADVESLAERLGNQPTDQELSEAID